MLNISFQLFKHQFIYLIVNSPMKPWLKGKLKCWNGI